MRWCTIVWKRHFLFCPQRNTLRSVLFWHIMQHRTVILYWHFRTNSWSHLQGRSSPNRLPGMFRYAHTIPYMNCVTWVFLEFLDCLTLEDGIDRLSCNMGTELPFYTAYHPRRAQISFMSQHKHEITFDVWLTVHRISIWNKKPTRCHLVYVYFYLSVAQHVSGHHVPIFRSWRLSGIFFHMCCSAMAV